MSAFNRIEARRELICVYDADNDEFVYPGTYHQVVMVEAKGTDGQIHHAQASTRDGLLDEHPRHSETVYRTLERALESSMRGKGVWDEC